MTKTNQWKKTDGSSSFNNTIAGLAGKTSELINELVNIKLGDLKLVSKKIVNSSNTTESQKEKLRKMDELINDIQVKYRTYK